MCCSTSEDNTEWLIVDLSVHNILLLGSRLPFGLRKRPALDFTPPLSDQSDRDGDNAPERDLLYVRL